MDGIVCGHIHKAELRVIRSVLYCNTGDWVESCTALVEDETGRLELLCAVGGTAVTVASAAEIVLLEACLRDRTDASPATGAVSGSPPYGRIARLYARRARPRWVSTGGRALPRSARPGPPPGARLLDAGCGTGLLAFWLLDRFPGVRVVAFDVDRAMVSVAARTAARRDRGTDSGAGRSAICAHPDRLTRFADGRPFLLSPGTFDGVFVGAALEHVPLLETLGSCRTCPPAGPRRRPGVRQGGMGTISWVTCTASVPTP